MNYHIKTKQRRSPRRVWALGVTVLFVVILGIVYLTKTTLFFSMFGSVDDTVSTTNHSTLSFFGSLVGHVKSNQKLQEENMNLQYSLSQLSTVATERDILLHENNLLKNLIDGHEGSEVARVVSSPAQSAYDIIIVALKPDSGVRVGDSVWSEGNVILGTVIKKTGNFAQVELFSSIGKEVTVRLEKDGAELLLSGRGGGNFFVATPRALLISENDIVVLPLFTSNILARVRAVEEGRIDSFKGVYLTYPVNVFSLPWVRITHAPTQ